MVLILGLAPASNGAPRVPLSILGVGTFLRELIRSGTTVCGVVSRAHMARRLCMRTSRRMVLVAVCSALAMLFGSIAMISGTASPSAADNGCVENPFGDRPIYLKGGFNGWSADPRTSSRTTATASN